jgi:hypothetical protein
MAIKITKTRIALALAGLALGGWIAFHPYRQAEVAELPPPLRTWIAQKPFGESFQSSVRHARLRSKTSYLGDSMVETLDQISDNPDANLVRKTTHHYAGANSYAVQEENTRLMAGPLILLRHFRNPLPIAGGLLPYSFWTTRKMRDLAVQQNAGFPLQADGRFSATYAIDELHSDGSLARSVNETFQCVVTGKQPAAQYLVATKGEAILFRCMAKTVKAENYIEDVMQENVYFTSLGWAYAARTSVKNNVDSGEMLTEITLLSIE